MQDKQVLPVPANGSVPVSRPAGIVTAIECLKLAKSRREKEQSSKGSSEWIWVLCCTSGQPQKQNEEEVEATDPLEFSSSMSASLKTGGGPDQPVQSVCACA